MNRNIHGADGMLPPDAFQSARLFLMHSARPLERAQFRAVFEGGAATDVEAELARYQNADGGFGHALEPDMRTAASSALCTSIALQIVRALGTGYSTPLAARAIQYLIDSVDRNSWSWRIIPGAAMDSPHAPWWNHSDGAELARTFGVNPTAEILGYLYEARGAVPEDVLSGVQQTVLAHFDRADSVDMHELACFLRLIRTPGLPEEVRRKIERKLRTQIEATVAFDASAWTGYVLRPLDVIDRPDSVFAKGHEGAVSLNLDHIIRTQRPNGSWVPSWNWEGSFPEQWELACVEWSGVITLGNLKTLRVFGRIPDGAGTSTGVDTDGVVS